ncbi:TPA: TetR/AcrR family transcriptional regulator [Serratia marcescens]|uniref:TetR/AcrR family transcriptional regulator n=1 Tax=Serratia nevei TaxID=2703794 RepID=UPI00313A84F0
MKVKMTRLRDAQRLATRRMLVDAAVRAFARLGYARCTVDEIAREAGASRATFYLYFKSKSDLLPLLIELSAAHFVEPYAKLGEFARAPDEAAVTSWISEGMREWSQIEDFLRPVYEATDGDPELLHQLFIEPLPGLKQLTIALIEADLVSKKEDAIAYAEVLLSPLLYYLRQHVRKRHFDRDIVAATLGRSWYLNLADLISRSK